ncbi:hypothetical protein BST28_20620 [Mycolicibacter kumamotonensis]|uniref:Sulfotransferase family protein n=1 Tax=Mycolicibacter kumamotonensis TaxID=354243 RepID=A0A1X0DY37_9MYCO|nr:hypothetical protein BST28_20620 [Mycolicibacter kumamotonensis]
MIAAAQEAEVGTLVLSSEEFAHAFPGRLARLKNALEGYDIHLVVTLNEIERRAGSIWQELVKGGAVVGLEKGIEQILSREPAIQPGLTRAFIDALAPHQTSVVLSHHRAPAAELLTNVCRALGLFEAAPETEAPTRASTLVLNQSLGVTETEILRSVNSWIGQAVGDLSAIPYTAIRNLYLNLFNTPIWRNSVPLRPITVPPAHVAEVLNRGRRELDDLRKLADEGRARIFGDLDTVEKELAMSGQEAHQAVSEQEARQPTSVSWGSGLPNTDRKTYVCFGVPSGGTSAVAGVMRKLGVFMGDDVTTNHEDQEMSNRDNPHRLQIIEKRNAAHKIWGWQDPHAVNYLNPIGPNLINPHYVIVSRDAVATMAHMRWRDREAKYAIGTIVAQQQRIVMFSLYCDAPVLFVSYEKLLTHPGSFIAELTAFLDVPPPQDEQSLIALLAPGS